MGGALIVLGGLPATGKSTVARRVAKRLEASWLRIDAIEQALRNALELGADVGEGGYAAAYAIAAINLDLGRTVVADCVNPVTATRAAWRAVASRAGSGLLEVEFLCSDLEEHRRRVDNRRSDIAGLQLPDWQSVLERHYEPWPEPHLIIDTARQDIEAAATAVVTALSHVSETR